MSVCVRAPTHARVFAREHACMRARVRACLCGEQCVRAGSPATKDRRVCGTEFGVSGRRNYHMVAAMMERIR